MNGTGWFRALTRRARMRRRDEPETETHDGTMDLVVRAAVVGHTLTTDGRLVVPRDGCCVASRIEAAGGVDIRGGFKGEVVSRGRVYLHKGACWNGGCDADTLVVEEGAVIDGGFFVIGRDRLTEPRNIPA